MKLLIVDCCIRGEASRTKQLLDRFLEALEPLPPEVERTYLNLMEMDLQYLSGDFFQQRQTLLEAGNRSHPRFDLAHAFAQADRIVIAAPFWDLSVPALLKVYIENISVDGITFFCDEAGMHGKCQAQRLLFLTTRGDRFGSGPMEQGSRYLEALCRMFGIRGYQCIYAEGLDADPAGAEAAMAQALAEAEDAARDFLH